MTTQPSAGIVARVARLLGATPVAWRRVERGYSPAERWIVRCDDGASAFIKVPTTPHTVEALRAEMLIYSRITADFLPAILGWEEGDPPILLLEDLSAAHWPPPWSRDQVKRVLATLAAVAATCVPPELPALESMRRLLALWFRVKEDPEPFLSLGLCTLAWLKAALPRRRRARHAAVLAGDSLLHLDVRSDNVCFPSADRVVLVDWNWACRGNPRIDIAAWLPTLASEGGPLPEEVLPDAAEEAALMSGFWAAQAGLPDPWPGSHVREVQRRSLRAALPWAARALGLPPPDCMP